VRLEGLMNYYVQLRSRVKPFFVLSLGLVLVVVSGCSTQSNKEAYARYESTDLTSIYAEKQDKQQPKKQAQQVCSDSYQVVSGDSLSLIAVKCNIKMSTLAKVNGLSRPYIIHVGQRLIIPNSDNATGSVPPVVQNKLPSRTQINNSYKKAHWQWPMTQNLEHRFIRDNAGITGLVVNCFPGMQVLAVADGEVVYVGSAIMQYGLMVMLKHSSGHMSIYAHNSRVHVKEGQFIKVGHRLASSGGTGLTDRPKLYVEARYRGKKVDIKRLFKDFLN